MGDSPAIRRPELRASLLAEEARETLEAITGQAWKVVPEQMGGSGKPDLVEAIDGMCDLLAVIYGTAVEFGVNLAPFWDEVHKTNMAKENPDPGACTKLVKPEGWQRPQLAPILEQESAA
jgi:predicted HAD superfamily Cof-like phosphohydrolase